MRYFIALAILAGSAGALGDFVLNHWAKKSPHIGWLISGVLIWNLSLLPFIFMLKKGLLAECVIAFLLTNSTLVLLMNAFLLKEAIPLNKWVWMIFGIISLVMMEKK